MNSAFDRTNAGLTDAATRLLRDRRTIHSFEPQPVDESIVLDALESACWAPNHRHTEPWIFLLPGPQTVSAIVDLNTELVRLAKGDESAAVKRERWKQIPGWICVLNRLDEDALRRREDYAACCCAIQNMALSLWSQGIGFKWTTGPVTRDPRIFEILGCDSSTHELVGLCWYGYPATVPEQKRKPLADVMRRLP